MRRERTIRRMVGSVQILLGKIAFRSDFRNQAYWRGYRDGLKFALNEYE